MSDAWDLSTPQTVEEVYAELLDRAPENRMAPRLDAVQRAVDILGNPEKSAPVIHITGTNGKTSTSRMIESLVRAHGLRTGLFTSPHLERFTERIMIDGEPIADAAVAEAWEEIEPFVALVDAELSAAGDAPLTFFELLTVLAFVAFADAPVDVAVIEVGMGGTWDSTNTADGDVAVIGPVALDHADRLGETVAEIAAVKAGIIKPGAAVVSAAQAPEAAAVIRARAAEVSATLGFAGDDFALTAHSLAVGGQQVSVRGRAGEYPELYLPLYGSHQADNAALAVAAVEALIGAADQPLHAEVVADGLGAVTSPGRLQLLGVAPTVLVDSAHNPHGARALATALRESFDFDEWGIVLGVLGDKDADGIVSELAPVAAHVFATAPDSERASEPTRVADLAEERGLAVTEHGDLVEAAEAAREWAASAERRAIVIAGSVILAGEAIALAAAEDWKSGWQE